MFQKMLTKDRRMAATPTGGKIPPANLPTTCIVLPLSPCREIIPFLGILQALEKNFSIKPWYGEIKSKSAFVRTIMK